MNVNDIGNDWPVSLAGGLVGDSLVHICKNRPIHIPFFLTDEECPSRAVRNGTRQTPKNIYIVWISFCVFCHPVHATQYTHTLNIFVALKGCLGGISLCSSSLLLQFFLSLSAASLVAPTGNLEFINVAWSLTPSRSNSLLIRSGAFSIT